MKANARYTGNFQDVLNSDGNTFVHSSITSIEASVPATNSFGIKYVDKGHERYVVRGKEFIVQPGHFVLINQGQQYDCSFNNTSPVLGYCVGLDDDFLRKVYSDLKHSDEKLLSGANEDAYLEEFHEAVYGPGDSLSKYLAILVAGYKSTGVFDGENNFGFYYRLAAELIRSQKLTDEQIRKIKAVKTSTKKELYDRLCKAKKIIDADISRNISVKELSREAALSEFHFYRSFKSAYGVSPHHYLLTKRMEKSMELVQVGNLPVTEIAYMVGYNDIYAFSKAFKQFFGVAPSRVSSSSLSE